MHTLISLIPHWKVVQHEAYRDYTFPTFCKDAKAIYPIKLIQLVESCLKEQASKRPDALTLCNIIEREINYLVSGKGLSADEPDAKGLKSAMLDRGGLRYPEEKYRLASAS